MGIRETINKRQRTTAGIVIAVIAVAVGLAVWNQSVPDGRATRSYYADEQGTNIFVDDFDKVMPFDHNGQPAYRAYVYRGADGKQFVSYLARYNDAAKVKLQQLAEKKIDPATDPEASQLRGTGLEVKKPGTDKWYPIMSTQGATISSHPTLADGSVAQMVMP